MMRITRPPLLLNLYYYSMNKIKIITYLDYLIVSLCNCYNSRILYRHS